MITIAHIAKPLSGVGIYISILSKHIDSNNFKSIVLCNKKDKLPELSNDKGAPLELYDVGLEREINFIKDFRTLKKTIKFLKEANPSIIHCHSAKAGILGRIAGAYLNIPTLYTPHAYSYLSAEKRSKSLLFRSIEKMFKIFPSKTLACSSSEFNRTINELKFKLNKVKLWNNSIEDDFNFAKINQELPSKFICSIGRPSYQKNTQLLIHSIKEVKKKMPNIHLVILGAGHFSPELAKVKTLIEELDLEANVTLIPWLKRSETLSILKLSNLYISTSRYEGLPYAVLEAMALSKACVLTNVDGHKDVVKNKINGFLVSENEYEISDSIVRVLTNEDMRRKMEIASRKFFKEKFTIKDNISLLEEIYLQEAE